MLRSPPDAHDEHLRMLLDQRTTRADLHSRVPSLSELSDTPSIYSHAFFSPRPGDKDVDNCSFASPSPSLSSARPRRAPRNRINELAVSMLDLDDDQRASIASESTSGDEDFGELLNHDDDDDDDDDAPMPRMSLLGPKMRFHSKAPWELDDGPLMEDDEGEVEATRVFTATKNNFVVGSVSQSRQASFDSNHGYNKRSLEKVYGEQEAQASVSSLSLAQRTPTPPRAPFSLSRVRSHSPVPQSPLLLPSSSRSPHESFISALHDADDDTLTRVRSNSSRPSFSVAEESHHPYANPNHVRTTSSNSYRRVHDVTSSLAFPAQPVSRSDSSSTVTEVAYGKALSRTDTQTSEIPAPRSPRSIFQGKGISSPMLLPLHQTVSGRSSDEAIDPSATHFPGWMDKAPSSPNFNLISLEEARAQRTRSATTTSALTFPEFDRVSGHSASNSVASRARARSISAGARAKQAITNIVGAPKVERRDSEPAVTHLQSNAAGPISPKNLKHKKSGFLRLFNGRDDKSPPPPVPSLSDGFAAFNAQQSTQKTSKSPLHRIPVPQLSPITSIDDRSSSTSPKRTPPPLSINTLPVARAPSTGVGGRFPDRLGVNDTIQMPQSAPANVTEFPALKLRPVSSMFSSHFGEHLLPGDTVTSPTDLDTPSSVSASTVVSPTTSVSLSRYVDKPSIVMPSDDQSSVIQTLQDQITSAKKAWQRHIWELEGQIRDLKEEMETLRATDKQDYCSSCGRGHRDEETKPLSVVNRPRARTGTSTSRFGSAAM